MSNGKVWGICGEIDCHSVNAIYYLKCKMCNEKESYVGKKKETIRRDLKLE